MTQIKVATWNIEHMHDWFDDTQPRVVDEFDGIARRVAGVIRRIDPHVLCIQEGPTRVHQMENFFADYLDGDWTVVRGETGASQKPYIVHRALPGTFTISEIDFDADLWEYPFFEFDEARHSFYQRRRDFTRLPVELIVETTNGAFSIMCLHLKSKVAMYQNDVNSTDPVKRDRAISTALEQRARILQEATLLRDYVQNHPYKGEIGGRMLVCGDLNDGPGPDLFEERFFSTDALERIRGDVDHVSDIMTDVLERVSSSRFTAIFYDRIDRELRYLLLDHLLVTPAFVGGPGPHVRAETARIEHAAYHIFNDADWSKRTKPRRNTYPSDHRPATVVVEY